MKNLKEFGVQEINSYELKQVNGGWLVWALVGLAFVAGVIAGSKDK